MQTFLPYPDFKQCFQVLDRKRLGNQVWREGLTLLRGKWPNHPVSKMWKGYEIALGGYCLTGLSEIERRYARRYSQIRDKIFAEMKKYSKTLVLPPWLGDERLHSSHRSNLLRKDLSWYSQFGWIEPPTLPYYWPNKIIYRKS